jgi:hypothetical protein
LDAENYREKFKKIFDGELPIANNGCEMVNFLRRRKMLAKRICIMSVLAGLVVSACGCTPSIMTTDGGVYSSCTLYAVASQDMTTVYQASLEALQELEIKVTDSSKDVFYAKVVAKVADGKIITIKIKPGEDDLTNFSIKVGTFGDKHRSRVIYDHIQKYLGAGADK